MLARKRSVEICLNFRSLLETRIRRVQDHVDIEIKFTRVFAVLVLAASCLIVSCSNGESNVVKGNRDGIIHVGNGTEPQSLDPHVVTGTPEINIVKALFEGLVTIDPFSLQPRPGVAESWHFSDDQRQVTFTLNPKARWSNGDPVVAEDFVWSWRRALDPQFGNLNTERFFPIKNAQAYSTGAIKDPELLGIKAEDAHTLTLTLNEPTPIYSIFWTMRPLTPFLSLIHI